MNETPPEENGGTQRNRKLHGGDKVLLWLVAAGLTAAGGHKAMMWVRDEIRRVFPEKREKERRGETMEKTRERVMEIFATILADRIQEGRRRKGTSHIEFPIDLHTIGIQQKEIGRWIAGHREEQARKMILKPIESTIPLEEIARKTSEILQQREQSKKKEWTVSISTFSDMHGKLFVCSYDTLHPPEEHRRIM